MNQNLPALLSTLNREISVLTEKLQPSSDEQAGKAFKTLLASGLSLPASMDVKKAPSIYAFALKGVPADGLTRAVTKVIRGEYDDISRAFMPTPPQLADLARGEARILVDDIVRLKERRDSMNFAPPPIDRSPEVMARVRALREKFKQENAANNALTAGIEHAVMTDDKAEYWAKINALKDAAAPTFEQREFRSKVETDLNNRVPAEPEPQDSSADIEF